MTCQIKNLVVNDDQNTQLPGFGLVLAQPFTQSISLYAFLKVKPLFYGNNKV